MGFHIRIDKSSERILRTLKTSPEEIFQRRYHCYLLFLVGASDDEAMDWLIKNVVSLDSLTGAEFAFGIFMKSLKIPLEIDSEPIGHRPKVAASIPAEGLKGDNFSIERVIKSHIHQHVYNGDEVMAITYATDIVAREFKVIDKLPCMLLLDPIPFGNVHVVQLTNIICNHLVKIIRQSIHRYLNEAQNKPNAFSYTSAILDAQSDLEQWECKNEDFVKRMEKMNDDLARLKGEKPSETGVDHIRERLDLARLHIENGSSRKARLALFGESFKKHNPYNFGLDFDNDSKEAISAFFDKEIIIIKKCGDTIDALTSYLQEDEVTSLWKDRLGLIYVKHVVPLLGLPEGIENDINKSEVKIWIQQLRSRKTELISTFHKLLPDIEIIEKKISEEYQKKNQHLIDAVQIELDKTLVEFLEYKRNYVARKKKLEESLDGSIRLYQENDPITFSSLFVKEMKSLKMNSYLSQTKIAGGKFAENMFKPDTIMKILEFLSKMTG